MNELQYSRADTTLRDYIIKGQYTRKDIRSQKNNVKYDRRLDTFKDNIKGKASDHVSKIQWRSNRPVDRK